MANKDVLTKRYRFSDIDFYYNKQVFTNNEKNVNVKSY